MNILFSPVGTADPLTILGDGPMLHIVRQCRPKKVVLFLSPAMAKFQSEDRRYSKAIQLLADSEGFTMPELEFIASDFEDVYRFDHYIAEFEEILERLSEEDGGKPILVNATSGTPAMEQALVALGAFGRLNLKLLQVTTPNRGINAAGDRENPNSYDLDTLWEFSKSARNENRIIEVESPHFAGRLLRGNVITLVNNYEYEAAFLLANQMTMVSQQVKEMIRAAAGRVNLDGSLAAGVFGGSELAYKPNDPLSEHIYVMEVRLNQGHWADFVRAMTPALTVVMKNHLRPYLPESKYLQVESGRLTNKINAESINRDSGLRYVLGRQNENKTTYITNGMLIELIDKYCCDEHVKCLINVLRDVECNCRNMLAHELRSSTKVCLERTGGVPLETVMQYFFELHGNAKPGLYKRINEVIINQL